MVCDETTGELKMSKKTDDTGGLAAVCLLGAILLLFAAYMIGDHFGRSRGFKGGIQEGRNQLTGEQLTEELRKGDLERNIREEVRKQIREHDPANKPSDASAGFQVEFYSSKQ